MFASHIKMDVVFPTTSVDDWVGVHLKQASYFEEAWELAKMGFSLNLNLHKPNLINLSLLKTLTNLCIYDLFVKTNFWDLPFKRPQWVALKRP